MIGLNPAESMDIRVDFSKINPLASTHLDACVCVCGWGGGAHLEAGGGDTHLDAGGGGEYPPITRGVANTRFPPPLPRRLTRRAPQPGWF